MHNTTGHQSPAHRHSGSSPGSTVELHDKEFAQFRDMIFRIAGITMSPVKKQLVSSRLAKRLRHHNLTSFSDYFSLISSANGKDELQIAVDSLTTNETHFFREPKHFDFLRNQIIPARRIGRGLRIWSAACSSGEEPYSIAMVLDDLLNKEPWEVVASDISSQILEKARKGVYPAERIPEIPKHYLNRYCLKGVGADHGTMMIEPLLRDRVHFVPHNLTEIPSKMAEFDVIFLRNVMIYFNQETKRQVVSRLLPLLRPGGYFLVGHSESLNGITEDVSLIMPAIYRKPE